MGSRPIWKNAFAPDTKVSPKLVRNALHLKDGEKLPVGFSSNEDAVTFTFSSILFALKDKPLAQLSYRSQDRSDFQSQYFESKK